MLKNSTINQKVSIIDTPNTNNLIEKVYAERQGGETIRQWLYELGQVASKTVLEKSVNKSSTLIIGVPRAGISFAQGIASSLTSARLELANSGKNRKPALPVLYNIDLKKSEFIIIADPIIDSGKTMEEIISELEKANSTSSIYILSLIATPDGIERLKSKYQGVNLCTFKIDGNVEWIQIDASTKKRIIANLGDIGELASKGLS